MDRRSSRSQMFFKIGALKNFANFTEKKPVLKSLFNKVAGLKDFNKRDSNTDVFIVKFAKFLSTPFFTDHLRWLLLYGNRSRFLF